MSYGVREYGAREYGDGMRVITTAVGGGPPPGNDIAGTDTLTFSESGTLSTSLRANDTITFTDSGTLKGAVLLTADTAHPEAKVRFSARASLSVDVPVTPPPSGSPMIKKVTVNMPVPTQWRRGRATG